MNRLRRSLAKKEVLVKIITFENTGATSEPNNSTLIEAISRATNSQTTVTNADRRSNEPEIREIQKRAFEQLGIFLERKRGEFADGVREGYLVPAVVVDRNIFLRAALVTLNRLGDAAQKKIMARTDFRSILDVPDGIFMRFGVTLTILQSIHGGHLKRPLDRTRLNWHAVSQAWVGLLLASERDVVALSSKDQLIAIADEVKSRWGEFKNFYTNRHPDSEFAKIGRRGMIHIKERQYFASKVFEDDARSFFGLPRNECRDLPPVLQESS